MAYYITPPEKQDSSIAPSLQNVRRGVGTEEQLNKQGGLGLETVEQGTPDSGISMGMGDKKLSTPNSPPFPFETPAEPGNPTIVPREILERFHFTFLIRHPNRGIPSYHRCCIPPLSERTGWEGFMPCEAGYDELKRLFDYCKDTGLIGPKVCSNPDAPTSAAESDSGIEICVIDADDLLDDPEGILRKYCQSIGVEFTPDMLNWNEEDQAYAKEEFLKWDGWHDDAIHSTDLKPRQHVSQRSAG